MFISEFNVQLLYLPDLKNVVADFLSCPTQPATGSVAARSAADPVDFKEMATGCLEMQCLLGSTSLKLSFRQTGAQCQSGDVPSTPSAQLSPSNSENHFFNQFYNVVHPGRLASRHLTSSRFVWCRLSIDVPAWAHGCLACQRGKIHRHTRLAPEPIPIPQRRFSHLHVDLVGPLQYSNNFNYICTIFTKKSMHKIRFFL